jgi:hypothetical protein
VFRIRKFLGLPDPEPDSLVGRTDPALDPIHPSSSINSKKNLYFYSFATSLKNDVKDPLKSKVRIRGSVPKCHGSGTLVESILFFFL